MTAARIASAMGIPDEPDPTYANPYVGLRPFLSEDSHLFFGRREQTAALLALLHKSRFLPVVGSSGSGKSSLVRAGLVPALLGGFLVQDRDEWLIATMKPGNAPLHNLAQALLGANAAHTPAETRSSLIPDFADALASQIEANPFEAVGDEILARTGARRNLLLVVDQFEEIFAFRGDTEAEVETESQVSVDHLGRTLPQRRAEADDFVALLLELAEAVEIPVYVVLTMRSDFAGDCDVFRGLPEAMNETRYLVPRLRREQLREAIEGPALLERVSLAPRLLDRLLNEMSDRSDQLPIVQHALLRTWETWRARIVTPGTARPSAVPVEQEDFDGAGSFATALAKHADQALDAVDKRLATLLFKRLTETDPRGRRVRRATTLGDLRAVAQAGGFSAEDVGAALTVFQTDGRHFISVAPAETRDQCLVDISHESLIRQWPTLRTWVDEERGARDEFLSLLKDYTRHQRDQRSTSTLLHEADLVLAERWLQENNLSPAWARRYAAEGQYPEIVEYIARSKQERDRARESRRRMLFGVVATLTGLTAAALWFGISARDEEVRAKKATTAAQKSALEAVESKKQVEKATLQANEAQSRTLMRIARETQREQLSCDEEKNLRLLDSASTSIAFYNDTNHVQSIYWLTYKGDRELYVPELRPHQLWFQQTYLEHPWLVTDAAGKCENIYWPADITGILVGGRK